MGNKQFFDQPVKKQQETYEKLIEMSIYDNYTTESLLDYLYHQNHHKRIDIDLSGQKKYDHSSSNQFYRKIRRR